MMESGNRTRPRRHPAATWAPFVVGRRFVITLAMGSMALVSARTAEAQEAGDWIVSLGVGGTLYGIETRFDDGTLVRGGVGYVLSPNLMVEGGVRRHGCFDCDRFLVLDAGLQARHRGDRFSPFLAAGGGLSSDPGFMGSKWGAHAAVGSWVRLSGAWDLQLEVRGRQVGISSSDYMGEVSVGVARRFRRPPVRRSPMLKRTSVGRSRALQGLG
jgi:hypothetical protein